MDVQDTARRLGETLDNAGRSVDIYHFPPPGVGRTGDEFSVRRYRMQLNRPIHAGPTPGHALETRETIGTNLA